MDLGQRLFRVSESKMESLGSALSQKKPTSLLNAVLVNNFYNFLLENPDQLYSSPEPIHEHYKASPTQYLKQQSKDPIFQKCNGEFGSFNQDCWDDTSRHSPNYISKPNSGSNIEYSDIVYDQFASMLDDHGYPYQSDDQTITEKDLLSLEESWFDSCVDQASCSDEDFNDAYDYDDDIYEYQY